MPGAILAAEIIRLSLSLLHNRRAGSHVYFTDGILNHHVFPWSGGVKFGLTPFTESSTNHKEQDH